MVELVVDNLQTELILHLLVKKPMVIFILDLETMLIEHLYFKIMAQMEFLP